MSNGFVLVFHVSSVKAESRGLDLRRMTNAFIKFYTVVR
jgi:hypothetical protein